MAATEERMFNGSGASRINCRAGWISVLAMGVLMLFVSPARASIMYTINLDGATIDLSGFITVSSLGSFSPTAFDANVVDFSITASNNGAATYVFTAASSTWGLSGFGGNVTINALAGALELSAPAGGSFDGNNVFLSADVVTNFARENLRLFQTSLGFRTPRPPNVTVFETVASPFTLGTAQQVPEPATLGLLSLGLAGLGFSRRKNA